MTVLKLGQVLLAAALLASAAQCTLGEDSPLEPPPRPPEPVAPERSAEENLLSLPAELRDPAFERFVDLGTLSEAALTLNAGAILDAGLQLAEGERVLLRPHRGMSVKTVLNAALRIATDQGDEETLDRLAKAAEKIGDQALAERVKLARELSSKTRATIVPVPELPEDADAELTEAVQMFSNRIERSRAIGDLEQLKAAQEELATSPHKSHPALMALAKQAADALAAASAPSGTDETTDLLRKLSHSSRAASFYYGPFLERDAKGAHYAGAQPYYLHTMHPGYIFKKTGPGPSDYKAEPLLSYYGLKIRYGTLHVAAGWQPVETPPDRRLLYAPVAYPDYVLNPKTNVWSGYKDQLFTATVLPDVPKGAHSFVFLTAERVPFMSLIGVGVGSFTYSDIVAGGGGNITLSELSRVLPQGGSNVVAPQAGIPSAISKKVRGSFTIGNIVAAGGGNLTIASIAQKAGSSKIDLFSPETVLGTNWAEKKANAYQKLISKGGAGLALGKGEIRYLNPKTGNPLIGQDGASGPTAYRLLSTQSERIRRAVKY